MKKAICILICAIMLTMCLCACGQTKTVEPENIGMPNPLHESDRAGVLNATGFELNPPEGAEDIQYFYIDSESPIAELRFVLDGRKYMYRAKGAVEFEDISGMYFDWAEESGGSVLGRDAKISLIPGSEGIVLWYDIAPGVMYSLSVDSGAQAQALAEVASSVFEPVQGDAG